jgi:hypothetical protein
LATALPRADDTAAMGTAREITSWDEAADPDWLEATDLPTHITCGHLRVEGTMRIAGNQQRA